MPLPYRQVLDEYDRSRAFGDTRDLSTFSKERNDLFGTDDYSAGVNPGLWTQFSNRLDKVLEGTVGQITEPIGEGVGSLFGHAEAGAAVGRGLPRSLLDAAPLFIPGLGEGYGAVLAAGATGGLMGAHTYADTGSGKAAAITGVTGALLPGVGRIGGGIASTLAGEGAGRLPTFLGKQAAEVALNQASMAGVASATDSEYHWDDPAFWLQQIPFTVYDALHTATVKATSTETRTKSTAYVPPKPTEEGQAIVEKGLQDVLWQIQNPNAKPEERDAAIAKANAMVTNPEATVKMSKEAEQVELSMGKTEEKPTPIVADFADRIGNTDSYRVRVKENGPDDPVDSFKTIFINGVEPRFDQETGRYIFDAKPSQINEDARYPLTDYDRETASHVDEKQPELPTQPPPTIDTGEVGRQYQNIQGQIDAIKAKRNEGKELALPMENLLPPMPKLTSADATGLLDMGQTPEAVQKLTQKVPKSGDLILDSFKGDIKTDPQGNVQRLGNTDVAADGWMNETRFVKATQIEKELLPAMKEAYPEAFDGKGRVNATLLLKGLKERPMVEVKKLGVGAGQTPQQLRYAQVKHELDTLQPDWQRRTIRGDVSPEVHKLWDEYNELGKIPNIRTQNSARYSFLGPKSEQDMPGYVDGLVRVPTGLSHEDTNILEQDRYGDRGTDLINSGEAAKIKYRGPHFGSEDTNVLAFFRGFEDKGENVKSLENVGKTFDGKVWHKVENQTDWFKVTDNKDGTYTTSDGKKFNSRKEAESYNTTRHPLASYAETLALKAELKHALSVGAKWFFVPDAETVMMTEGHDKVVRVGWTPYRDGKALTSEPFKTEEQARNAIRTSERLAGRDPEKVELRYEDQPSQSAGMRLHYDTTLSSTVAKLTGEKGERVELGGHKGVKADEMIESRVSTQEQAEQERQRLQIDNPDYQYRVEQDDDLSRQGDKKQNWIVRRFQGSPVFRNPDGTPKTQITGCLFSLDKITSGLSADDTLSIKEAVARHEQALAKEARARQKVSQPLTSPEHIAEVAYAAKAKTLVDSMREKGASDLQIVEAARLVTQTPEVDAAAMEQNVAKAQVDQIVRRTSWSNREQQQNKYGAALKDEQGRRRSFVTESEAQEWLDANPDPAEARPLKIRDAGADRGDRRYYIAPVENATASLDVQHGEGGEAMLHNVIPSAEQTHLESAASPQMVEEHFGPEVAAITERPQASVDSALASIDSAINAPELFAEEAGVSKEDAVQMLKQARAALPHLMENPDSVHPLFADKAEQQDVMQTVARGLDLFGKAYKNYSLSSEVSFDETLVSHYRIRDGAEAMFQRIAADRDLGIIGEFLQKMLPFVDWTRLELRAPGHPEYSPVDGWMYKQGVAGNKDFIQLGWLPSKENIGTFQMSAIHELVHHIDLAVKERTDAAALQYGQAKRDVWNALRKSPEVPKKVRDLIQRAIDEKHIDKLRDNRISEEDLLKIWRPAMKGNEHLWYFVYGMADLDEVVPTLLSNPWALRIAQETRMPKKQGIIRTVIDHISSAFNAMIGGKPEFDSAFSQIAASFDNALTGGLMKNTYNGASVIRDALIHGSGVRPEALMSRMNTVDQTFSKGTLEASITGFEREARNGMLPQSAETGELNPQVRAGLLGGEPRDLARATITMLAADVPVHRELYTRMRQDLDLAQHVASLVRDGTIPGMVPVAFAKATKDSNVRLNVLDRALTKQELAIQRATNLENFTPDGLERMLVGQLYGKKMMMAPDPTGLESDAIDLLSGAGGRNLSELKGESVLSGASGGLRRMFLMTQFMKQLLPSFRAGADHVKSEQGRAFHSAYEAKMVYNYDPVTKEVSKELTESNARVMQTPALARPASDIKRYVQQAEAGKIEWKWKDKYIQESLKSLNQKDRDAIKNEFDAANRQRAHATEITTPEYLFRKNKETTALVIAANEYGMLPDNARELSAKLYDGLTMLADPQQMATGMEMLRAMSTGMKPETYIKALQLSQGLVADSNKHIEFMRTRPNWATEQRGDKHHLIMQGPDGKPWRMGYETKEQANAARVRKESEGFKYIDYVPKASDSSDGIHNDVLTAFAELDRTHAERLKAALPSLIPDVSPDVMNRILESTQRAQEYAASLNTFSAPGEGGPIRKFIGGREEINMVQNGQNYYVRVANYMRHVMTRLSTDLDLLHPELQQNREAAKLLSQHVENQLSPDNPFVRKAVEATYFTRLAWNFGVNFLHGIQSLTTGMASVIAETGSVKDAYAATGGAMKALADRVAHGNWKNPEHKYFSDRLKAEGRESFSSWDDFSDQDSNAMYDANRAQNLAASGLRTIRNAARSWTGAIMKYNSLIGGVAGFDLARERGMSIEDSYKFATDMLDRGYYAGGKQQRAVGLWGIKTKAVPQLLSSLQSYTFGWFGQLSTNMSLGFGKAPEGLTETQRLGAKKAVLYQLGAQAVLAGALGLPGVGQGMALLKQTTGIDSKEWLKDNMSKMFGEDLENGGFLTSLALHGAVAATTPMDPSGRHIANFPFIGVTPFKGFSPENLLPAPVTTAADLIKGMLAAARGDVKGVAPALPHVLQGPFRLWQDDGDVRDSRGGLQYQLSPSERFLTALGMTSSRVQAAKDSAGNVKTLNAQAAREKEVAMDSVAKAYRTDGVNAGQSKLLDYLKAHPTEDYRSLVNEVKGRVEAQTMPVDPRRSMKPGGVMIGERLPSSEVARRSLRSQVSSDFGVPDAPHPLGDLHAHVMDNLLDSNPYLSPVEARQRASSMLRAGPVTNRPYSPGFQAPNLTGFQTN